MGDIPKYPRWAKWLSWIVYYGDETFVWLFSWLGVHEKLHSDEQSGEGESDASV